MCRLFAALSTEDLFPPWFLHKAPQSLLMQSHADAKRLQADGWGVGWFESGRPRIRKSPNAMFKEKRLVQEVAQRANGTFLLGHVRWASNPMKLPKKEISGLENTQPFTHDRWIFMHNGTLLIPREVRAELGPWERLIQGNNDSEVLFYWFMKYLSAHKALGRGASSQQFARALRESFEALDDVWSQCKKRYPIHPYPTQGVNCAFSDGERMASFSYVNAGGFGKTKALCKRSQPYYQLQHFQTPNMFAIASEPLDPAQAWKPFHHGELRMAQRTGKTLKVESWPLR